MISQDVVEDLSRVALDLDRITAEHGKCLACHCYREVGEEFLATLDTVKGHEELFTGPAPENLLTAAERLRDTLESSEGTHG